MTDINEARPYEILIRFDPVTGALKGSHLARAQVVVLNGELVMVRPLDPEPIAATDAEGLWGVLSAAQAAALATNEALAGQADQQAATIDALRGQLENSQAQAQDLAGQVGQLTADLEAAAAGHP